MKVIAQVPYTAKVDTLNALDEILRLCRKDWGIPTQNLMDGHNWVRLNGTLTSDIQRSMTEEEYQVMHSLMILRKHLKHNGPREI